MSTLRHRRSILRAQLKHKYWVLEEARLLHEQLFNEFRELHKEFEAVEKALAEEEGKIIKLRPNASAKAKPAPKPKDPNEALKEAMAGMSEDEKQAFVAQLLGL